MITRPSVRGASRGNCAHSMEPLEVRRLLTALVKDIVVGPDSSGPSQIADVEGVAFFAAETPTGGRELWKSDGTAAGTSLVLDINPGAADGDPSGIIGAGDIAIFAASNGAAGVELWRSDGTAAGTRMIRDINPGAADSSPGGFLYLADKGLVIFSATSGSGREVWVTDGTTAGTVQLADINPGAGDSDPAYFNAINGQVVFWAFRPATGIEFYRTNGTPAGTALMRDINPGADSSGATEVMGVLGNFLYFSANNGINGFELWRTNGTTANLFANINTQTGDPDGDGQDEEFSSFPVHFTEVLGDLYFRADNGINGAELFVTDGTTTSLVRDIRPGPQGSAPVFLRRLNNKLIFRANDGTNGAEPWVSDGSAGGTTILKNISASGSASVGDLVVANNLVYFAAGDDSNGVELWQTDGTPGGTVMAQDINPGSDGSFPTGLAVVGGAVFFAADNGTVGQELWSTGRPATGIQSIKATEGKTFSGPVGSFSNPDVTRLSSEFRATILWGDGGFSNGIISQPQGAGKPFVVSGTHIYRRFGGYPVIITITDLKTGRVTRGNVNLSKRSGNQAEGAVAVDPSNPKRIYVQSNSDTNTGDFSAFSLDGGLTWTTKFIGTGADGLPRASGDPKAAYDKFGNLFVTYLFRPGTGFSRIIVLLSTNGGKTFREVGRLTSSPNLFGLDQPSLSVGPGRDGNNQAVWVAFKDISSRISIAGAPVTGLGQVGSFTMQEAPGSAIGNFGDVAVGDVGQVVTVWQNQTDVSGPATIFVNVDEDGLGPKAISVDKRVTGTNIGGFYPIPAQPTRTIDAEGNLAFDRSTGRFKGRLYLVYTDSAGALSANTDIYIRYSDDNGFTWSDREKISDAKNASSQFLPSIAVDDKTGRIVCFWHDTRNDPINNVLTETWATMSSDGGETWTPNVPISVGRSTHQNGPPPAGFRDIDFGDYTNVSLAEDSFFPVWADNSTQLGQNPAVPQFDLATSRVPVAQIEDAPIRAFASNVIGTRFRTSSHLIGTFADSNPYSVIGDFTATIDWGDGTTSKGTIARRPVGGYNIFASKRYNVLGRRTVTVRVESVGGSTSEATGSVLVVAPVPTAIVAAAPDAGGSPNVKVYEATSGRLILNFLAFNPAVTSGVRVAVGDVNGDTFPDIIAATGPGAAPFVRVFNGISGDPLGGGVGAITPFDASFRGGVYVAAGDLNGDFKDEVIVSSGPGIRATIAAYNGAGGAEMLRFQTYPAAFTGGARVVAVDANDDFTDDIIVAPGPGAALPVRAFNGETGAALYDLFPFGQTYRSGIFVGAADADADGFEDLLVGTDAGVAADVRAFDAVFKTQLKRFIPTGWGTTGVRLAGADFDFDGTGDLVVAGGKGAALPLRQYAGLGTALTREFFPFGPTWDDGIYVAAGAPPIVL
jgi:ELWxxDGT repeat protein